MHIVLAALLCAIVLAWLIATHVGLLDGESRLRVLRLTFGGEAGARGRRGGTSKIFFAPTISNKAAPTQAEITAGTDLTPQLAEINGVTFSNQPIDVPDFSSAWTKKIPGEDQADDPALTFYEDSTSNPIKTALAKGTAGYLVLCPWGSTATKVCEVWPVTVASNAREWSAGNEAARYVVKFTTTDPMVEGVLAA